jgi:hypothetical protein
MLFSRREPDPAVEKAAFRSPFEQKPWQAFTKMAQRRNNPLAPL